MSNDKPRRLKPAGHSAFVESLIEPSIVIAATLLSVIAAYVLAQDELTGILNAVANQQMPNPTDVLMVALCAGMGAMIGMVIVVSATRFRMHSVRNDPRENFWKVLALIMLILGLGSETMTALYFFVHMEPSFYPHWMVQLANGLHAFLAGSRAFMIPAAIAYFSAGILPVRFDRADRNREIIAITSVNIMELIRRLGEVKDTDDTAQELGALGGQMVLNTYAHYDDAAGMTEETQMRRDSRLLEIFGRINGLDWNVIGQQVAPELVTPTPQQHVTAEHAIETVRRDLHPLLEHYPPAFDTQPSLPSLPPLPALAVNAAAMSSQPPEPPDDDLPPTPPDGGPQGDASRRPRRAAASAASADANVTPIRRSGLGRGLDGTLRSEANDEAAGEPADDGRADDDADDAAQGGTYPPRRTGVRTPRPKGVRTVAPKSAKRGRRSASSGQSLEAEARRAWAAGARSIDKMLAATSMSRTAAAGWVRTLKAEQVRTSESVAQEGA